MRKRAIESQETYTVDSYNKELIRHNSIYSELVSYFISNSETMISHLNNLPHEDIIKNMSRQSDIIKSRFTMLNEQFTTYDKDIRNYKNHISGIIDDREEKRSTQISSNPESQTKAQKE